MPDVWPEDEPEKVKLKSVDKYDGKPSGYKLWRNDVRIELQNSDLEHHMSNESDPDALAGDASAELKKRRKLQLANKRHVYTFLYKSLAGGKLKEEVAESPYNGDPFKTLALIETKCHTISSVSLKDLKKELDKLKMRQGEKLESVVARLDFLVAKLSDQDHKVEDSKKRDVLVDALCNEEWDKVVESEENEILKDRDRA